MTKSPNPPFPFFQTRDATLGALETLAAGAETELILAFRTLAPDTPLLTEPLRERGLNTWADLIAWITRRGVRLFMLLGDEDPVLASARHRRAWLAASGFANVAQGDAQILVAPHGQSAGWIWRVRLRRPCRAALASLREDDPRRLTQLQRDALAGGYAPRPLSVNQSFAIADEARALIGGFSADHARSEAHWHDVATRIDDADFAGALRAHFADGWHDAMDTGAPTLDTPPRRFRSTSRRQSRPELRLWRTLSEPIRGPGHISAGPRASDALSGLVRLFSAAKAFVYIETSAFREPDLAEALCQAARAAPDLKLVVLLQPGADRLPFAGALAAGHEEKAAALQAACLVRIARSFGPRAVFLQQRREVATSDDVFPPLPGRVVIVDGTQIMLGSHALTARALRQDTEASVLIRDAAAAERLLQDRAVHWLGQGADAGAGLACWKAEAERVEAFEPRELRLRRMGLSLPDALF